MRYDRAEVRVRGYGAAGKTESARTRHPACQTRTRTLACIRLASHTHTHSVAFRGAFVSTIRCFKNFSNRFRKRHYRKCSARLPSCSQCACARASLTCVCKTRRREGMRLFTHLHASSCMALILSYSILSGSLCSAMISFFSLCVWLQAHLPAHKTASDSLCLSCFASFSRVLRL